MAERLQNSGFWTYRFLVAPKELKSWVSYINEDMGISLVNDDGDRDSPDVYRTLFESYQEFYDGLTSMRKSHWQRKYLTQSLCL
jgi:hypothetical protein